MKKIINIKVIIRLFDMPNVFFSDCLICLMFSFEVGDIGRYDTRKYELLLCVATVEKIIIMAFIRGRHSDLSIVLYSPS